MSYPTPREIADLDETVMPSGHGFEPGCPCRSCKRVANRMLQQERAEYESGGATTPHGRNDSFEGHRIKVIRGETGRRERFEFLYGGAGNLPDGAGHGHVVSNDGVNIAYWRTPQSEGGRVLVDDLMSQERLGGHMF